MLKGDNHERNIRVSRSQPADRCRCDIDDGRVDINIEDGSLAPAMGEFLSDGEFHSHPETGAIIDGATVPQWSTVLDLALGAHQQFSKVPFIGWEVGLCGAGPVVVEAGTNWGVFRHVIPTAASFIGLCHERLAQLHPECAKAAGIAQTEN